MMKVGTRSILFGVHCWILHPWFVAWAWWKLYGFPWDPRLWVAFVVHDWGYWGKPNMDGPEGENHVWLGAWIVHCLFDWPRKIYESPCRYCGRTFPGQGGAYFGPTCSCADGCCTPCNNRWFDLCLYHSRFYAKRDGQPFSRLCVADKLAVGLTPAWLYLPLAWLSGELAEYMAGKGARTPASGRLATEWYRDVRRYCATWAWEHHDGREDTWTGTKRDLAIDPLCEER